MPPIAIGGFPENKKNGEQEVLKQKNLLNEILGIFNAELGAPEDDKEFRVISTGAEPGQIKIAFGTSDNTYPEREDPSFWPSAEKIDAAAIKIIDLIKRSGADINELVIESWTDATFRMYKPDEIKEDKLQEPEGLVASPIEKFVDKPVMDIIVSSSSESIAQAGGDVAEFESGFAAEFREKLVGVSPNAKSFFDSVSVVAHVVTLGEVDFSIEFDGQVKDANDKIPLEIRKYMANSALHVLGQVKPDCSGEIWVRQGTPNASQTYIIE
ncbi:MAG: hypothetical protein WCI79_02950 [Candidatus Saccharibacteria bacterium]